MYCPKCGTQLPDDSIFCENCGLKLDPRDNLSETEWSDKPTDWEQPKTKRHSRRKPVLAQRWFWSLAAIFIAAIFIALILVALSGRDGGDGEKSNYTEQLEERKKQDKTSDNSVSSFGGGFGEILSDSSREDSSIPDEAVLESFTEEPAVAVEEKNVLQYETDNNGLISISTEEAAAAFVQALSTSDYAKALDFEWFLDCELSTGFEAGLVITNPGAVNGIQGDEAAFLNGGWKAFLADTLTKPFNPYIERYFNVNIDTDGEQFNVTMNWKYMFFPEEGRSKEEEGIDLFKGIWDRENSTATCRSDYGMIVFDHFFIASDTSAEYATGTFYWISGEVERIALMRTAY